MFEREDGSLSLTPNNDTELKLFNYLKRKNNWHHSRRFNDFRINDDDSTVELYLNDEYSTLISFETLARITQECGRASSVKYRTGTYANIRTKGGTTSLHRFIMAAELSQYEGFEEATGLPIEVNHINEDTLDNTIANLEVLTGTENKLKSHLKHAKGYRKTDTGKYQVFFKHKYHGTYTDEVKAAAKYRHLVVSEIERLERIRFDWLSAQNKISV